ncbi:DUF4382 domain-containing protein [Aegicerativicinus sediminis]
MNNLTKLRLVILLSIVTFFFNCSDSVETLPPQESTNISVTLESSLASYDALNVEISDVLVKTKDNGAAPDCWISLHANGLGNINLLELTNGSNLMIVNNLPVKTSEIYEVRLVLGNNNTVIIDGQSYSVSAPENHQEGLSVPSIHLLKGGNNYTINLKVNIDNAVVENSVNNYKYLNPTMEVQLFSSN